ncbi:MAG: tRNA uridine-5-carboxymethylaminomethyl(34) synthesis GTPase MnmE [Alphaproteobacteria bacterium]|nr:tRNA uridine-5-carboxymethylaminomethyl(34) synthesis GTPase MnmE [Alphaproteobacteria bacterium]
MSRADTIFAVSTGGGRAGVAVIRVSGRESLAALRALIRNAAAAEPALPAPRILHRANLRTADGALLDEAMAVHFLGPNSFTGEDVVELHTHGSPAVVRAVLSALSTMPGLRPAEAGEFTQRAFLNGKMDLAAVEGLGDLIDAQTEAQRRLSLRQLGGALSDQVLAWRESIIMMRAETEAWIDFPDEDLPTDFFPTLRARAAALAAAMQQATSQSHRLAAHVRDGFSVALVGPPNVGKSSLLNALAAREVAIVTDVAGTTRDALSVPIELDGFLVNVVDTAGMRDTADKVESIGVDRAIQAAETADLVLWLIDQRGEDPDIAARLEGASVVKIATKQDLWTANCVDLGVSVISGEGLDAVLLVVRDCLLGEGVSLDHVLPMGRQRHAHHVGQAVEALGRCEDHEELALLAECMRDASAALGRITGAVDVEDVLDHIFSRFCIGK